MYPVYLHSHRPETHMYIVPFTHVRLRHQPQDRLLAQLHVRVLLALARSMRRSATRCQGSGSPSGVSSSPSFLRHGKGVFLRSNDTCTLPAGAHVSLCIWLCIWCVSAFEPETRVSVCIYTPYLAYLPSRARALPPRDGGHAGVKKSTRRAARRGL